MAVAEVVVVEVAAAAGTATRTTDMVAATMAMATRAAVVTDGNGAFCQVVATIGYSECCSFWTRSPIHACLLVLYARTAISPFIMCK